MSLARRLRVALLLGLLLPAYVYAHDSRPLYIEISERTGNLYAIDWRVPPTVAVGEAPRVTTTCPTVLGSEPQGTPIPMVVRCDPNLAGQTLEIRYPVYNPSLSTLVRIRWLSGAAHTLFAAPDQATIKLPPERQAGNTALQYLKLGVEHIVTGYDHLLFLGCLMLLARHWRRILLAVSGFTVAHSVTLAAAALGFIAPPVAFTEAAIALSVVFLATELARERRDTLTWQHPIVVSSTFGLLHGFGFASVLTDIGLPSTDILTALVSFNVGVELGQVAIGVIVLVAVWCLRSVAATHPRHPAFLNHLGVAAVYCVGVVSSFWFIERLVGLA